MANSIESCKTDLDLKEDTPIEAISGMQMESKQLDDIEIKEMN